jgi:hypothetical protein
MIARFIPAALLIAPLALAACKIEKAPANPPATTEPTGAAAPAVTAPIVKTCPPVGYWKAAGPTGDTEIKVSESFGKPGAYDVSYKGVNLANGAGTQDGNKFTVDTGQASGGMYACNLAEDCKTMSCGFTGQAPTVFTKTGS